MEKLKPTEDTDREHHIKALLLVDRVQLLGTVFA